MCSAPAPHRHAASMPFDPMQQASASSPPPARSRREQLTSRRPVAASQGIGTSLQELFRFALPLRERAAGALDVGARLPVGPVEKEDAGPDVDRQIVPAREVVVEAGQQQLFDSGSRSRSERYEVGGPIGRSASVMRIVGSRSTIPRYSAGPARSGVKKETCNHRNIPHNEGPVRRGREAGSGSARHAAVRVLDTSDASHNRPVLTMTAKERRGRTI